MIYDDPAQRIAHTVFGIPYLFPWQQLVIANILNGAGKQIVLLPTGAGKSLCFLVPAFLLNGPTLIIYPLIALMTDQQRRIEAQHITCAVFKGGQTPAERNENIQKIKNGTRIILANPEVLCDEKIQVELSLCHISHIAIDEVHCVSEWGDSFRPAYRTLAHILEKLDAPVVTGFTATASPPLLERVSLMLFKSQVPVIRSPGDRSNIHYEVRYAYSKITGLLRITRQECRPMIIFCSMRKTTEMTARLLNACHGPGVAYFYHAGLTRAEKGAIESWFFTSTTGILVATCAYGMGIDKPDIRTVVHLDCPEHLENFIQEAGRGGRDGKNAKSILLWSHTDSLQFKGKTGASYVETHGCRRQFLLNYLGYPQEPCSGCDFCDAARSGTEWNTDAPDAEKAICGIQKQGGRLPANNAAGIITAYLNKEDMPLFHEPVWNVREVKKILSQLISEKRIIIHSGISGKTLYIAGAANRAGKILTHCPNHRQMIRCLLHLRQMRGQVLKQFFSRGALAAFLSNAVRTKQNRDR